MNSENAAFYGEYARPLAEKEEWLVEKLQKILDGISTDPEDSFHKGKISARKEQDGICFTVTLPKNLK